MEIWELGARKILSMVEAREVTAQEVLDSFLARTFEVDPDIAAYLEVIEPDARFSAAKIDALLLRGDSPGLLAGLPCAVKDNMSVIGAKLTCGSRILKGYVAPYDATAVRRLRNQGATITGKTNLDEFAMGSSTETSAFGPTGNPWDLDRVPGGSSGGSAAAVAAGMVPVALGSDTGGSIRQPAAFTGICGLKPTYGLVSRYGAQGFAPSMDTIGPFGTNVWDCALVLEAIAGPDINDSRTTRRERIPYTERLGKPIKGLRAGVPKEFVSEGIDSGVMATFNEAIALLSELGVVVEEISIPSIQYARDMYRVLSSCEAASTLARFDGVRYGFRAPSIGMSDMYLETRTQGFGQEAKRRIMLGTVALSSGYYDKYYLKAARFRTALIRDFQEAFGHYDVLLTPSASTVAFKRGQSQDSLGLSSGETLTCPANLVGIPALSVPMGFAPDSLLPCGLQIMGKYYDEETVLNMGFAFEEALGDEVSTRLSEMRRNLLRECDLV
ncbi:MAG: Asp-tRNA(Asn)/Glu-tRNA(Gln) amidotransferase subunit GatA [Bacillota bacterium]